jgi:16S rRNA (adenine1518-N6/adenine1519-N6)-dimethyltransferase
VSRPEDEPAPLGSGDPGPASEVAPEPGATALLKQYGLRPKRSLGQNFLADSGLCAKIARSICPDGPGQVLEIGAGTGALTRPLLAMGCRVVAIETDSELSRVLRETLAGPLESGQLRLIEADVRDVDLAAVLGAMPAPRRLAGNLPYHLSGLLLRRAVEVQAEVERSVFLLQLEVVERLCAAPDTEAYGALSVFVQAVAKPERAFVVKRGAFYPQPNVDSAVVVLTALDNPSTLSEEFTAFVRAAFEKRRKTLRNAWRGVLDLEKGELEALALAASIDLNSRGETLSVSDFERMAVGVRQARSGTA